MQLSLKIYGKVQGVFFRKSAKLEAEKLGLTGWVRNEEDGSVRVVVVGTKEKLEKFAFWCKKGPPFAKVSRAEEDWQDRGEDFESFEVLD